MRLPLKESTIRSWQRDDASSLPKYANNRNVWRNLRDLFPHPYTKDDAQSYLQSVVGKTPETHFAIEVDGEAIGGIGVTLGEDIERFVGELGYWLGEPYWGRGIMTEAVRAFTQFAVEQYSLQRVEAGVFQWNPASVQVLEKAGFTLEATMRQSAFKDGQVIDRWLYAYAP